MRSRTRRLLHRLAKTSPTPGSETDYATASLRDTKASYRLSKPSSRLPKLRMSNNSNIMIPKTRLRPFKRTLSIVTKA